MVQLGGFDENLLSFQDWEIHVRALIAGVKYFKCPMRDHFYRFQYDKAGTISSVSNLHQDHLDSREYLFVKTLSHLKMAGLFDDEVRARVTGLFWWLTTTVWKARRDFRCAEKVWRKAAILGLCNSRQCYRGTRNT